MGPKRIDRTKIRASWLLVPDCSFIPCCLPPIAVHWVLIEFLSIGPIRKVLIKKKRKVLVTDFIFLGSEITEDGDCHSVAQSCPTLCDPLDCSTPGFSVLHHLPELAQTHVHGVSDAIQTSHPLSSPSTAFNLSQHQGNESAVCIRGPKYWSFSFSISPSNDYSGLISFRIDWFDLLAVQGTLKSLLQHHSSKASILWHSAFFMVQLSLPCMTTGKTIALIRWTFVSKVMSLLINMLSRFVLAFLSRSKHILISWQQS